jgi:predicted RNase H-like nuclease (RuvC/YqgF family)
MMWKYLTVLIVTVVAVVVVVDAVKRRSEQHIQYFQNEIQDLSNNLEICKIKSDELLVENGRLKLKVKEQETLVKESRERENYANSLVEQLRKENQLLTQKVSELSEVNVKHENFIGQVSCLEMIDDVIKRRLVDLVLSVKIAWHAHRKLWKLE